MFAVSAHVGLLAMIFYHTTLSSELSSGRIFPQEIVAPGTNTPLTCLNHCAAFGYSAAGLEVRFHASILALMKTDFIISLVGPTMLLSDHLHGLFLGISMVIQFVVTLPTLPQKKSPSSRVQTATWPATEILPTLAAGFFSWMSITGLGRLPGTRQRTQVTIRRVF